MMTDVKTPAKPLYHAVCNGPDPVGWIVAMWDHDKEAWAQVLAGQRSEKDAHDAARVLNELRPEGRTDEVLGRMMGLRDRG